LGGDPKRIGYEAVHYVHVTYNGGLLWTR
jgi:hypothetical protein